MAGAEQAALGVLPAHERLDPAHAAGAQLGLRLVVEHELAGLEGGAELAHQREPLAAVVVAPGEVDLVAGAHALGLVHRDVGALQQPHGVRRVVGVERDADAGVDVHVDAADRERLLERRAQAQPRGAGGRLVAGLEDDRELVAAEARERVVAAQQGLQARADLAQHLVAGVVPERVVELLEAVEVDQQQRQLVAVVLGRRDRGVQRVDEVAPVAEPGEVVGERLRLRLAQALDDGQPGARHAGEHGGGGEPDGDRVDLGELAGGEQAQRDRGEREDRGEHDRAELLARPRRRLGQPRGGGHRDRRDRREPRARGQRRQAGEREQQRAPGPPAAEPEAGRHAGGADHRRGVGAERHGERRGGGAAHGRVEPRQPVDPSELRQHEQRDGDGGEPAARDQRPLDVRQLAGAGHRERDREGGAPGARAAAAHGGTCTRERPRQQEGARD